MTLGYPLYKIFLETSVAKDLSHVPCKFFKLGQCTAGSSCPFSHHIIEPGQQKDVCQWFVKGNCKFGHKCALAHVLPGQPMSMDRKNKKAAQQAAAAAGGGGGTRGDRRKTGGAKEETLRVGIGRGIGRGAAPMSISKATISPSAPAPPLRDTDFPFGLPDDFDQPVLAQTQKKQVESSGKDELEGPSPGVIAESGEETAAPKPVPESVASSNTFAPPKQDMQQPNPLPLSTPSTRRGYPRQNGSGDFGFGPIGSPPRSSPGHTPTSQPAHHPGHRINGFSPSTSPSGSGIGVGAGAAMPSTSPFSAPGTKSVFMSYSLDRDSSTSTHIKASANTLVGGGGGGAASLSGIRGWDIMGSVPGVHDEEDDLEEFLPSSLNELLTDEEKKRRWSRTGGQRPTLEQHHRYSHSVPAASLMDNVKNIWNENGSDMQSSGGPSPSLLGTSNVSTGFMPRRPAMPASRAFSDSPHTTHPNNIHFGFNGTESPSTGGFASPPLTGLYSFNRPQPQHHPATSSSNSFNVQQPRPIPGAVEEVFNGNPLSPSARALQEHAPGQSLPQGLAAGLSRIHIKPPVTLGTSTSPHHIPGLHGGSPSPGLGANMGRGMSSGFSSSGDFLTGLSQGSPSPMGRDPFDRLPSIGSRSGGMGTPSGNSNGPSPSPSTMGMGFRRQQWASHPLSSPLSGPVITNDDADGLFAMDEDAK